MHHSCKCNDGYGGETCERKCPLGELTWESFLFPNDSQKIINSLSQVLLLFSSHFSVDTRSFIQPSSMRSLWRDVKSSCEQNFFFSKSAYFYKFIDINWISIWGMMFSLLDNWGWLVHIRMKSDEYRNISLWCIELLFLRSVSSFHLWHLLIGSQRRDSEDDKDENLYLIVRRNTHNGDDNDEKKKDEFDDWRRHREGRLERNMDEYSLYISHFPTWLSCNMCTLLSEYISLRIIYLL